MTIINMEKELEKRNNRINRGTNVNGNQFENDDQLEKRVVEIYNRKYRDAVERVDSAIMEILQDVPRELASEITLETIEMLIQIAIAGLIEKLDGDENDGNNK